MLHLHRSKRRSERVLTDRRVLVLHHSGLVAMDATDVNEHGIFLRTPVERTVGSLVRMHLLLPDGPISVSARVRFCGETVAGKGLGVELFGLTMRDRSRWLGWYYSLLPDMRRAA